MNSYTAFVFDKYAETKVWECITREYPRLKDFVADLKGNGYAIRHAVLTKNYHEACEKWHRKNEIRKQLRKEAVERTARAKIKIAQEETHRIAQIEAGNITKEELDDNYSKAWDVYMKEGRSQEYENRMDAYRRAEKYKGPETENETPEGPSPSESEEDIVGLANMARIEVDSLLGTLRLVQTVNPDAEGGIQLENYSPHWKMSLTRTESEMKDYSFWGTMEIMNERNTGGKIYLDDGVREETAFASMVNGVTSVILLETPPEQATILEQKGILERNASKITSARSGEHLVVEGTPPWGTLPWDKLKFEEYEGSWYVIDVLYVEYSNLSGWCFLLESEKYGDEFPCMVIDKDRKVLLDDAWNGWDDLEYMYDE